MGAAVAGIAAQGALLAVRLCTPGPEMAYSAACLSMLTMQNACLALAWLDFGCRAIFVTATEPRAEKN